MSIEALSAQDPDHLETVVRSRNIKDRMDRTASSLYHSLALEFATRGRNGIVEVDRYLTQNHMKGILLPGEPLFEDLQPGLKRKFMINFSGIMFGVSMRTIETMLGEQRFSLKDLHRWINNYTIGTQVPEYRGVMEEDTDVSDEEWAQMLKLDKQDPTHSIYFRGENIEHLPYLLKRTLRTSQTLNVIRDTILPIYSKFAAQISLDSQVNQKIQTLKW